jgi:predicted metal-dependent hydrolase
MAKRKASDNDVKRKEVIDFLDKQQSKIKKQIEKLRAQKKKTVGTAARAVVQADIKCRLRALEAYKVMADMTQFACCDQFLDCPDP